MKKIMFNDRYGLTQAVLEGRKTQTPRAPIPARTSILTIIKNECMEKTFIDNVYSAENR